MGKFSLVDEIKNQVKNSGSNKKKLTYFKSGVKVRIRFLSDMDEGMKIAFHDSYAKGINVPCQEVFGRTCSHDDDEELRTRDLYAWSVWNYEAKEVQIMLAPVNNCSPIPALVGMYDTYGTLTDRDYVITKNGSQTNTTYSVVPMDKVKFKNKDAKPLSESKMLSIIDKAFPDDTSEDDDDEDEKPKKKGKKPDKKPKPVEEDEEEDDEVGEDEDETDYENMSSKELYKLCQEREIKVKPKKDKEYYIEKLEEYDEENEDSDDEEDEEDEW